MGNNIDLKELMALSDGYSSHMLTEELEEPELSTGELEEAKPVENIAPTSDFEKKSSIFSRFKKLKEVDSIGEDTNSAHEVEKDGSYQQDFPQEDRKVVEKYSARADLRKADDYETSILEEEEKASSFYLQDENGQKMDITKKYFLVGCGSMCDLVIKTDPEKHTISRRHAYIIIKNDTLYLKDVSSNGTFIGNPKDKEMYKLPKDTEVEVREGQFIKFADVVYSFGKR